MTGPPHLHCLQPSGVGCYQFSPVHSQNALAECKGVSKFDQEQSSSRENLQSVVLRAGFRKDYLQEDERI
jgi:hypothetical protein